MKGIAVNIIKLLSDDFPGFVECKFIDAWNKEHTIKEKIPVVSSSDLNEIFDYPQKGSIACEVIRKWMDTQTRSIVTVTISTPWSVETTEGVYIVDIVEDQLIDLL